MSRRRPQVFAEDADHDVTALAGAKWVDDCARWAFVPDDWPGSHPLADLVIATADEHARVHGVSRAFAARVIIEVFLEELRAMRRNEVPNVRSESDQLRIERSNSRRLMGENGKLRSEVGRLTNQVAILRRLVAEAWDDA